MLGYAVLDREVRRRSRDAEPLTVVPLEGILIKQDIGGVAINQYSGGCAAGVRVLEGQPTNHDV